MSITEIIQAVQALSRGDKFQLAPKLVEELAADAVPSLFKEGRVYPIYTPEFGPDVATQLALVPKEEAARS